MAVAEFIIEIAASPDEVYRISQDYSVRYEWDPFPEEIRLLNGAESVEKGVRAFVKAKYFLEMEVEFVNVSPPKTAAIVMQKGPFFLGGFAGSWVFTPLDNGSTMARFRYSIKVKKWALPFITDRLVASYFLRSVKARLLGLKHYCEKVSTQ